MDAISIEGIAALLLTLLLTSWLWIACRGPATSAWGSPPYGLSSVASDGSRTSTQPAATRLMEDNLNGRPCWLLFMAGVWTLVFLLCVQTDPRAAVAYVLCFVPAVPLLMVAWCRIGKRSDISPGLLAIFFLSGGLLSTACVIVPEEFIHGAVDIAFPECRLQKTSNGDLVVGVPLTMSCQFAAALQNLLGPAVFEESLKAIWLFYRLRRSPADIPNKCCFCFPTWTDGCCCGCSCWFKLAPSPYHVVLCALATGAGFESFENMIYVFVYSKMLVPDTDQHDDGQQYVAMVNVAVHRVLFSILHVLWTGLIGIGLAKRLFSPVDQKPKLVAVLLPPILLHAAFDYSLTASSSAENAKQPWCVFAAFSLTAFAVIFSWYEFCVKTGCSCTCGLRPGFWREEFGYASTVPTKDGMRVHYAAAAQPLLQA